MVFALHFPYSPKQEKTMSEDVALETVPPMSQGARVVNSLFAPSKTFTDIRRSAACWLPIVLMIVLSFASSWAIGKTVGFEAASETQISKDPKSSERMQALPPDQRAHQMALVVTVTKVISYCIPLFVLVVLLFEALILWASFNFGLGAQTKFLQVFAVILFAGIPRYFVWILSIIFLFAGVGTDNFDMKNPVGTNLGYYLSNSPHWMQTAGQFFDIFTLWTIALIVLGMAIISGKKIAQSATIVIGWWALVLIVSTAFAAF